MKKKVLFLVDFKGWAWYHKACSVAKCLSDTFEIDCWWPNKGSFSKDYDLYFTFCPPMLEYLRGIERERKVTGTTSHIRFNEWFTKDRLYYEEEVIALHANSSSLFSRATTFHKKVFYLPNGVDTSLFKEQPIPDGDLIVGFVGSAYSTVYKGLVDYILPATLKAEVSLKTSLQVHPKELSLEKMAQFYKKVSVYVVASKEEGTPNPLLEAASCGRPVIANRVGNVSEFMVDGESGFIVDRQVNAYAIALAYFKENPSEIERMGKNARKQAEKWDWKVQAENYRKMFQELI